MAKSKKTTKPTKSVAAETKVRRVEADENNQGSPIRGLIIIALLILGLLLIYNAFARDVADEAAVTDEQSKTEAANKDSEKKDDEKKDDKVADQAQPSSVSATTVKETDKAYEYVVGEGESYTTLARRAVASVDSKLTTAERVAAETKLSQDAGGEWLNAGQDLALTKEKVRAAVDWAKGLSEQDKAAWQPWADLVAW